MIAATLLCLVIYVSDGDTLTARCDAASQKTQTLKVRLAGIDAPERHQPYGSQARKALQALVLKKNVTLRCNSIDRYKRHICTVWVAPPSAAPSRGRHTLDVGHALLTQGMAWWYRRYAAEQPSQQRSQYEYAEKSAKAKRAGLWGSRKPPVAPWQWRAARKR